MTNREEVIEYFKSVEKEKFLYDGKKATFSWWCSERDNKHGVVGGYSIMSKIGGMGIPFSESEDIKEIIENIEKYLVNTNSRQLRLF